MVLFGSEIFHPSTPTSAVRRTQTQARMRNLFKPAAALKAKRSRERARSRGLRNVTCRPQQLPLEQLDYQISTCWPG